MIIIIYKKLISINNVISIHFLESNTSVAGLRNDGLRHTEIAIALMTQS